MDQFNDFKNIWENAAIYAENLQFFPAENNSKSPKIVIIMYITTLTQAYQNGSVVKGFPFS
jgi:hypothetical protein